MSKLIVTTSWDDGQKTDLKLAKFLTKYGIKGTFYITKSYGSPLEKHDVAEIDREHEIGGHTLSHLNLPSIPIAEAEREIKGSKIYSEDIVGHSISMFCYPYGKYNKNIKKIVQDSGFIAARTSIHGSCDLPEDPYEWRLTLLASNGSPLAALKIWWKFHLWRVGALFDWESRAKLLFDLALRAGGVFHMYGHSTEFERNNEWDKLERVLDYISNREDVRYMTNGEAMEALNEERRRCA